MLAYCVKEGLVKKVFYLTFWPFNQKTDFGGSQTQLAMRMGKRTSPTVKAINYWKIFVYRASWGICARIKFQAVCRASRNVLRDEQRSRHKKIAKTIRTLLGNQTYALIRAIVSPKRARLLWITVIEDNLDRHQDLKPIVIAERLKFRKKSNRSGNQLGTTWLDWKTWRKHVSLVAIERKRDEIGSLVVQRSERLNASYFQ